MSPKLDKITALSVAAAGGMAIKTRDRIASEIGNAIVEKTKLYKNKFNEHRHGPKFTITIHCSDPSFNTIEQQIQSMVEEVSNFSTSLYTVKMRDKGRSGAAQRRRDSIADLFKTFSKYEGLEVSDNHMSRPPRVIAYEALFPYTSEYFTITIGNYEYYGKYLIQGFHKEAGGFTHLLEALDASTDGDEFESHGKLKRSNSDFSAKYIEAKRQGALSIAIRAKGPEALTVLKEEISNWVNMAFVANEEASDEINFSELNRWGGLNERKIPKRSLSSVVTKDELGQKIKADIIRFLNSQEIYDRMGIPFHRGYLLYGPPGTGKTSLIRALASELDMSIMYANLNSLASDGEFSNIIGGLSDYTILVLEDIDGFSGFKDRDQNINTKNEVSTSGLLNILDGLGTPNGLIVFATTNYKDKIDEAMLRDGRFDFRAEMSYLESEQLAQLFKVCYDIDGVNIEVSESLCITAAEIQSIFKVNLEDPENAIKETLKFIEERTQNGHKNSR